MLTDCVGGLLLVADMETAPYAVYVRGACKTYGSGQRQLNVLERLDMSVPKGSM